VNNNLNGHMNAALDALAPLTSLENMYAHIHASAYFVGMARSSPHRHLLGSI
jgi:hypothetical protein